MPRADRCPFNPPPALKRLQAMAPIHRVRLWDSSTAWLVTRYADQRALLSDPRLSADAQRPGYPHLNAGTRARRTRARALITMDEPEHTSVRRLVTAPFTVKRAEALRPTVQRIVDDLIDDLLRGPNSTDLVQALALPVPSLVICELLGVPYTDHGFFQHNTGILFSRDAPAQDVLDAERGIADYLNDLVARKVVSPGDDLLSKLAAEQLPTGALTQRELASLGLQVLAAGHETTASMIALGTLVLLEHPRQLAMLRETADPQVVAGAVEELLRYLTVAHSGQRRVALEDVEIGGVTIRAGEGIILANDIANRDPEIFHDPDRLDLRCDARRHVAFGFGPHQCLGQSLVRVELQVVYGTLYRRIPTLRIDTGIDTVPFKHDGLAYGVHRLPVTW